LITFTSFAAFAAHLERLAVTLHIAETAGLDAGAAIIQAEAKAQIGHYMEEAAGPFAPWPELADKTKEDRLRLKYTENDPLLRDGTLRDNIDRIVIGREAAVGVPHGPTSESSGHSVDIGDVAIWQELGTNSIQPRSFLGSSAVRKTPEVVEAISAAIVRHIAGLAPGERVE